MEFLTVLDIGGGQEHARIFRENGKRVIVNNLTFGEIIGDYLEVDSEGFDCVWASHVLEHCPNPGLFLSKCFNDLNDNGILAVTVPPLKHEIVGGHVTLWNAGILLYQTILAGFDCSKAWVKNYGYNISLVVRKKKADLPELNYDFGDIDKLSKFFPFKAVHGFDGRLGESIDSRGEPE